jgi:hypothetical protein
VANEAIERTPAGFYHQQARAALEAAAMWASKAVTHGEP